MEFHMYVVAIWLLTEQTVITTRLANNFSTIIF